MKTQRLLVVASLGVALHICGCMSPMEQFMHTIAEQAKVAKANPLTPLPEYPQDAQAVYDASSALVVVGDHDVSEDLASALKEAGHVVVDAHDAQSALFRVPDISLCPSVAYSVVYGDGAAWFQIRLVVCLRSAVRIGSDGAMKQWRPTRIFQVYERIKVSDESASGWAYMKHAEQYAARIAKMRAAYPNLDIQAELPHAIGPEARNKEDQRVVLQRAVSRLMRIDAFRRAISGLSDH